MRAMFYHTGAEWTGSARVFDAAARGLAARGWEITVVCVSGSGVESRLAGAEYEVFAIPGGRGWLAEAFALQRIVRDRFVEVGFVPGAREHLVMSVAQRMAGRGAVVRRAGAGERLAFNGRGRLAMRLVPTGYLFATDEDLARVLPLPPRALEPVVAEMGVSLPHDTPSAVDPERTAGEETIVCLVGSTSRGSIALVLRTVAMLRARHPGLRLVLAGRGADAEDHRMHAAALGIHRSVSHVSDPALQQEVLRGATLGWVAADADDFAFGCLDLMALRIPVLAERGVLAQHYVSDGIAGLLLPPEPAGSAALVATLLAYPERRIAMGAAGRNRVLRDFTEEGMVGGFEHAAAAARDRRRWHHA